MNPWAADVPIDESTYLSSHNSAASAAHGFIYYNQDQSILWQLNYGVRHLQLDSLLRNGTFYSVHGTWSETKLIRGGTNPEALGTVLDQIRRWLTHHTDEVIFLTSSTRRAPGPARSSVATSSPGRRSRT